MTKNDKESIRLHNRSDWPDWFLGFAAAWVRERAGKRNWRYDGHHAWLRAYGPTTRSAWRGTAYVTRQLVIVRIGRRPLPKERDTRYSDGHASLEFDAVRSGAETLVYLLAHEFRHLTDENQSRPRGYSREFDASRFGIESVKAWRTCPKRRRAMFAAARKYRRSLATARTATARQAARKAKAGTTESKIMVAQGHLKRWEAEARKCETRIKIYKRKLRALNAALSRRAAATSR